MTSSTSSRKIVVLAVCLAWASASAWAQTTWHVDDDNCPGPGSGTPADPYCTIQEGINAALNGDTVQVADGTYTGAGNRDLFFAGRLITVRSENGPSGCIIDCEGTAAEPHRAFSFQIGETSDAVLEGFTIKNGFANGDNGGAIYISNSSPTLRDCVFEDNQAVAAPGVTLTGDGGAVYCTGNSSSTIEDCLFLRNTVTSTNAVRTGCGGAVFTGTDSTPTMQGCEFFDNKATSAGISYTGNGGAIRNVGGDPVIRDCLFIGNEGIQEGDEGGGGGAIASRQGDLTIEDCRFIDNKSGHVGGAVSCDSISHDLMVARCTFIGNHAADHGGGMWLLYGEHRVFNCVFAGNTAEGSAAILTVFPASAPDAEMMGCVVVGNRAGAGTGGIGHKGAAQKELRIINCTVVANQGDRGGIHNQDELGASAMTVSNSAVWDNAAGQIVNDPNATTTVTYSDVEGGHPGTGNIDAIPLFIGGPAGTWTATGVYDAVTGRTTFYDDGAAWVPGQLVGQLLNPDESQYLQSMIVTNTETTVTAWGDFADLGSVVLGYRIHDYHVQPASPVIDAADKTAVPPDAADLDEDGDTVEPTPVGLDGNPRFVDDPYIVDSAAGVPPIVDMGPYEFQLTVYPTDFDADWDVDGNDFAVLASCLSGPGAAYLPGCEAADLDGDGDVDMEEFYRFQQQFTGQ